MPGEKEKGKLIQIDKSKDKDQENKDTALAVHNNIEEDIEENKYDNMTAEELFNVLTDKQKVFCNHYLENAKMNQTQAAVLTGYSKKTAYSIGNELLKKPEIQAYIRKKIVERIERTEITQDRTLKELSTLAFSNIADFLAVKEGEVVVGLDKEGLPITQKMKYIDIYNTDTIPRDKMSAVASIKQTKHGIEIKMHNKDKPLELLAQHQGLTDKKVIAEVTHNINIKSASKHEIGVIIQEKLNKINQLKSGETIEGEVIEPKSQ